jgi:hypothetical protein
MGFGEKMEGMKIEIRKLEFYHQADLLDMPGSPPLGIGYTGEMAIVNLFQNILLDETYREILIRKIDSGEDFKIYKVME